MAGEYARRIGDELRHKPFDREILDRFAERLKDRGPVCDMGCGPGHVTRYLHERGLDVSGIDLSEVMVERARRANEGIEFRAGDFTALDVPDGTWAGIVAFYSLIHVPPDALGAALRELHRTLRPSAPILIAFHVGTEPVHLDEWWGEPVSVDFFFFTTDAVTEALEGAGFEVETVQERNPYPEVEHQSRRAYITARAAKG